MEKSRYPNRGNVEDARIISIDGVPVKDAKSNNTIQKKTGKYTLPRSITEVSIRWENVMKNATAAELILKPVVVGGASYYLYGTPGLVYGTVAGSIIDILSFLETPKQKTPNN